MFNSVALDVVIGLIFVYLLYSLLATIIMEIVATWLSFRAKNLRYAVSRMLDDSTGDTVLSAAFYNHPLIKYLGERSGKRRSMPAYLNTGSFSKVLLDLLRSSAMKPGEDAKAYIQQTLDKGVISWHGTEVPINKETLNYLNSIWVDCQGEVSKFEDRLENWFDETMERASGWYKKKSQVWLFCIGLIVAVIFNVDTFMIVGKLQKDPKLREQLIQQADAFLKAHPNLDKELEQSKQDNQVEADQRFTSDSTGKQKTAEVKKLDSLDKIAYEKMKHKRDSLINTSDSLIKGDIKKINGVLGMGINEYECEDCLCRCLPKSILGWCITALALSLGAPFWFDLLNKLMKLRSSITSSSSDNSDNNNQQKNEKGAAINPKG